MRAIQLVYGVSLLAMGAYLALLLRQPPSVAELPVMGRISDFKLTERSGQPLSAASLKGKIWVADFIFSSCQNECPLMNQEMAKVQDAFSREQRLRLVSFSVDPKVDTPARLADYARRFKAQDQTWLFATGDQAQLERLASKDFKLMAAPVAPASPAPAAKSTKPGKPSAADKAFPSPPAMEGPFLHSQKFVLVDGELRIRGYYDSRSSAELQRLMQVDLPHLLSQAPQG